MRKEVKIGIYAVAIILTSWVGIKYLQGVDIFGRTATYYAYCNDASGLQSASAVAIRGVKVGQVSAITIDADNPTRVIVELSIAREYKLPVDSRAEIFSAGLMGGKGLEIVLGSASDYLQSGDAITVEFKPDLLASAGAELGDVKERLIGMIDNINTTLKSVTTLVDDNQESISAAIANLNAVLADFKESNIIGNIDNFSQALSDNSVKLDSIVTNVNTLTSELSDAQFTQNLTKAVASLESILAKANSNEGTVGGLFNDRALYDNLTTASKNLSALLADLKANPKRYVHFSMFGQNEEKMKDKAAKKAAKAAKKAAKKN
ncbi:MAG: MCE family protein [Alistipes sp.]|nr:MCE family protein [Alistipes sp.]